MTPIPLFSTLALLAQAPSSGPGGIFGNALVLPLLMVVMIYFLLIRPQQRQRKEQAARVEALQAGDRVVTTAGIHGIVHNIRDHTVVIKVAEGTMIEFDKAAIGNVQKKDAAK